MGKIEFGVFEILYVPGVPTKRNRFEKLCHKLFQMIIK